MRVKTWPLGTVGSSCHFCMLQRNRESLFLRAPHEQRLLLRRRPFLPFKQGAYVGPCRNTHVPSAYVSVATASQWEKTSCLPLQTKDHAWRTLNPTALLMPAYEYHAYLPKVCTYK